MTLAYSYSPEWQYLNSLREIIERGEKVPNRTGTDTLRVLGLTHRYNFEDGFPLLTTKKVWMKGIVHELLWFLRGEDTVNYLVNNGVNIWNDDAYRKYVNYTERMNDFKNCYPYDGMIINPVLSKSDWLEKVKEGKDLTYSYVGPIYGVQWRRWSDSEGNSVDQIQKLVDDLKNNPSSRRHIISSWNVLDIDDMALPPCHVMSQFTITNGNKLWCHMYQRSCDMFLGVPFNIASYSLLTYMLAQVCGLEPGGFIHTMHDAHVYVNHIDAVKEQLKRQPRNFPTLRLSKTVDNIDNFKYEDIVVEDYNPYDTIKADLVT